MFMNLMTRAVLLILIILTACAPHSYVKPGASRQEFMLNYSLCENGTLNNSPIAVGTGQAALMGMTIGAVLADERIQHCMGALGWEYGRTYEGYRP